MESGWMMATIMILLCVFGVGYNALVEWVERRGYREGYTALLVGGGVLITLVAAIPLVGVQSVVVIIALFLSSGLPMLIGSIARHVIERQRNEDEARRMAEKNLGDST